MGELNEAQELELVVRNLERERLVQSMPEGWPERIKRMLAVNYEINRDARPDLPDIPRWEEYVEPDGHFVYGWRTANGVGEEYGMAVRDNRGDVG